MILDPALLQWHIHRVCVDRLQRPPCFSHGSHRRALVLTELGPICTSQVFPLFYWSRQLRDRFDIEFSEMPLHRFLQTPPGFQEHIDLVLFQTWFNLSAQAMLSVIDKIRDACPDAQLIYLDWFAPTDLRYAVVLNNHVSWYVKKTMLTERDRYGHPTIHHTNLSDYYSRRFQIQDSVHVPPAA